MFLQTKDVLSVHEFVFETETLSSELLIPVYSLRSLPYLIIPCGSSHYGKYVSHSNGYAEMQENLCRYFTPNNLIERFPHQAVYKYG